MNVFEVSYADEQTIHAMVELRKMFGVSSNVEVVRKSLALARVCADSADSQNIVTFLSPTGAEVKVSLST